jgi:hypothetical protein
MQYGLHTGTHMRLLEGRPQQQHVEVRLVFMLRSLTMSDEDRHGDRRRDRTLTRHLSYWHVVDANP